MIKTNLRVVRGDSYLNVAFSSEYHLFSVNGATFAGQHKLSFSLNLLNAPFSAPARPLVPVSPSGGEYCSLGSILQLWIFKFRAQSPKND